MNMWNKWKIFDWTVKGVTALLTVLAIVASIALCVAIIFGSFKLITWLL